MKYWNVAPILDVIDAYITICVPASNCGRASCIQFRRNISGNGMNRSLTLTIGEIAALPGLPSLATSLING